MGMNRWCVYIVRCRNGSLYTGITNRLEERIERHNAGTGAKYTRAFRPVELVYKKICVSATQARKREAEIKAWSKGEKEALVAKQKV